MNINDIVDLIPQRHTVMIHRRVDNSITVHLGCSDRKHRIFSKPPPKGRGVTVEEAVLDLQKNIETAKNTQNETQPKVI
jgi:hypothetical protein